MMQCCTFLWERLVTRLHQATYQSQITFIHNFVHKFSDFGLTSLLLLSTKSIAQICWIFKACFKRSKKQFRNQTNESISQIVIRSVKCACRLMFQLTCWEAKEKKRKRRSWWKGTSRNQGNEWIRVKRKKKWEEKFYNNWNLTSVTLSRLLQNNYDGFEVDPRLLYVTFLFLFSWMVCNLENRIILNIWLSVFRSNDIPV